MDLLRRMKVWLSALWMRAMRANGVFIGPGARVAIGSQIKPGTVIGHHTHINGPAVIRGAGKTVIGPYCAIGHRLNVLTENHATHVPNMQITLELELGLRNGLMVPAAVEIGPACWIGDDVTVLPGVTIGAGAVVGACSVVSHDVEPFTVVAGVPARELRRRCSREVAQVLLDSGWWEWTPERMQRNRDFFNADITAIEPGALAALAGD
jgi:acetyltransferase-like isoleucine patch superfamily enzyme